MSEISPDLSLDEIRDQHQLEVNAHNHHVVQNESDRNKSRNEVDNVGPLMANVRSSLNSEELHEMMLDPKISMLIMDCRSKENYDKSRIKFPYIMNVPKEILSPDMTPHKIQQKLPEEMKSLWQSRDVKDNIIIIDWNSRGFLPDSYIWRLYNILNNSSSNWHYQQSIFMLEHGYEHFLLYYPMYCTDPDSAYDDVTKSPIKILNDDKTLSEILEYREDLSANSVKSRNKMLRAEASNENSQLIHEKEAVQEAKLELLHKEQELKDNLVHLRTIQRNYKLENDSLRKEMKLNIAKLGQDISEREAHILEEEAAINYPTKRGKI